MNSEQLQQQQEQRRHRRHRKVSFALRAQALVIPSLEAYSERQKGMMWQTPSEKEADQAELVKTVRAARRGILQQPGPKSAGLCGRGLEHLCCPTSMRLKVRRRELLLDAVLDNQEEQWQRGTFHADPEIIRTIAVAHTKVDTERAIRLAAEDEAFVRSLRKFDEVKPNLSR